MGTKWDNFVSKSKDVASNTNNHVGLFLICAILIHLYDGLVLGFSPASFMLIFLPYMILTIAGIFFVFKPDQKGVGKIILITVLAIAIPRAIAAGAQYSNVGLRVASTILVAAPVWLFYLYFNEEYSTPGIKRWGGIYFFVFLLFGLVQFWSVLPSVGIGMGTEGIDADAAKRDLLDYFNPAKIGEGIFNWKTSAQAYVKKSMGEEYFTGTVEQNEDAQLGVYIEDLKPGAPLFYEGNDVIVWGTIRGKSFQGNINTKNDCYARQGTNIILGDMYPNRTTLFYDEAETLECVFNANSNNALEEGYYTVTFTSSFDFPTWGYITYYYVDKETIMSFYFNKKNINTELNIPRKSEAVYTNGPASIGIMSLDMPISVEMDDVSFRLPSFGTTLANAWPQGEVITIKDLIIMVPDGITFEKCSPNYVGYPMNPMTQLDGSTIYRFSLVIDSEAQSIGNANFFTTITCRPTITSTETFMGLNEKVVKTFSVAANYSYSLERNTNIRVKALGGVTAVS